MNHKRGSLWRKWDLHIHTPESFTHRYSGPREAQWSRFLDDLEALPAEFKVIGINDYVLIEGYKRVLAEKQNGRLANIDLILPVIELRLDMFAGTEGHLTRVNLHVIFSDDVTPETIETQFLSALPNRYRLSPEVGEVTWSAIPNHRSLAELGQMILNTTPAGRRADADPVEVGFNSITFSIDKIKEVLEGHYFKGKHLVGVGKTEWAAMRWSGPGVAEKKHVINSADLVFTAAESPHACAEARGKLRAEGVTDRLFDCSDAHAYSDATDKDRIGNCYTWVKADTTFAGLCHALKEYDGRVYLGDAPPKLGIVSANGSKFIRSVMIRKKESCDCQESWFDCELELSHDLVAIIGRKGSGKSALTDVIGLLCDATREKSFSFLNPKRFRDPKENKSKSFVGRLRFESGPDLEKDLNAAVDGTAPARVNYIPQSFFEELCGEIVRGEDAAFQKELEDVVFARLSVAARLERPTLRDLVAYRANEIDGSLRLLRESLDTIGAEIAAVENELLPESRSAIEKMLERKKQELADHDEAPPVEVAAPVTAEGDTAAPERRELVEIQTEIASIETRIGEATATQQASALALAAVVRVEGALANLERRHAQESAAVAADLLASGLEWGDLVSLTIDRSPLNTRREELTIQQGAANALLDGDAAEGLPAQRRSLADRARSLTDQLSQPERRYQEYLVALDAWQVRRGEIVGDARTPGTMSQLTASLARLDGLPDFLAEKRRERLSVAGAVYDELAKLAQLYRELYTPVQDFVDRHEVVRSKLRLRFSVHMKDLGFQDQLLQLISRNVRGTFSGSDGPGVLKGLIEATDFDDRESTLEFVGRVDACLHREQGRVDGDEYRVDAQLRKGVSLQQLYRQIFALEYLQPEYSLCLGDKPLSTLSPGERGALLLIFYLLVDDSRMPVVLDQPDENLDNETVFELLVPCIREAKQERQLIVVTHNPNIAVVCDAEQVIHAAIEKGADCRITYTTGAIENPTINKHLLDVLEGTRPAFQDRDDKYLPTGAVTPP